MTGPARPAAARHHRTRRAATDRPGRTRRRRFLTPAVGVGLLVVAGLLALPNSAVVEVGLVLLAAKLLLSGRPLGRVCQVAPAAARREVVVVVVPMFNEDPGIVGELMRSLVGQTRRPDRIHVVDDGSSDSAATISVRRFVSEHPALVALSVHPENRGKREAIATGLTAYPEATVVVTVDSDTVLAPDALARLLAVFADPTVMGATAMVRVLNRQRNVLTRLIDLRYANAFLLDRGFQSRLGSVLCACGSLAAWRAKLLRTNLDDFTAQTFLGRRCVYGDDRRLTNYALRDGRVVLVPDAVAWTAAPERLAHYLRQQLRWSRSFVRESLWAVGHLPLRRAAVWLAFVELTGWITFTVAAAAVLLIAPLTGLRLGLIGAAGYLVVASVTSWLRSVRWFDARVENECGRERVLTFALAPLYALLHIFLLLPLRCVALATLRTSGWGTRTSVEVRVGPDRIRDTVSGRRMRSPAADRWARETVSPPDVPPVGDPAANRFPSRSAGGRTEWTARRRYSSSTGGPSYARD